MPGVLAVVSGTPPSLEGRSLAGAGLTIERFAEPESALARSASHTSDLLVIAGFAADQQAEIAAAFHANRRWRVVPVLYVIPGSNPGFIVPANYRPELDGIARGEFGTPSIEARIRLMAREGTSDGQLVVAGPLELDALHGRVSAEGMAIDLTVRETEILGLLLEHVNQTVPASQIIERGWGALADEQHLQILRRHVSNLRRKLGSRIKTGELRTVRGQGYRFDLRSA